MELSILIPSRNEMFLKNTIEDILKNIEADTEIIVVLDGAWADPPIPQNDRVNTIYLPEAIGQRAATNLACRLSKAKFVMKCDAHCAFDKGFDRKMIEGFKKTGDNVMMVPVMRNLWAFDWKCYHCGWRHYQGPTPEKCGWVKNKEGKMVKVGGCDRPDKLKRKMVWVGKEQPQSSSFCFDSEPHFQYFNKYKKTDEYKKDLETGFTKTMSLQGSCFMVTRENYWKWDVCDEKAGSWGNQGIELALATWFNGGQVLCNHSTWYAHMFRTQGGDFGFPYEQHGREVQKTKDYIKNKYWKPELKDLLKRFNPPGWTQNDLDKIDG